MANFRFYPKRLLIFIAALVGVSIIIAKVIEVHAPTGPEIDMMQRKSDKEARKRQKEEEKAYNEWVKSLPKEEKDKVQAGRTKEEIKWIVLEEVDRFDETKDNKKKE